MTRLILTSALLLLLVAPAHAQTERTIFRISLVTYAAAAIEDARETRKCVEAGICREANPALIPFVDRHGIKAAMAGKLAVQGGIAGALIVLRKKYSTQATAALAALAGLQIAVDIRNYRTLQRAGVR